MASDRALDIMLMILFGMGGLAVMVIAWVQPLFTMERILATLIGSAGFFWVLARVLLMRRSRTDTDDVLVPVIRRDDKQ